MPYLTDGKDLIHTYTQAYQVYLRISVFYPSRLECLLIYVLYLEELKQYTILLSPGTSRLHFSLLLPSPGCDQHPELKQSSVSAQMILLTPTLLRLRGSPTDERLDLLYLKLQNTTPLHLMF